MIFGAKDPAKNGKIITNDLILRILTITKENSIHLTTPHQYLSKTELLKINEGQLVNISSACSFIRLLCKQSMIVLATTTELVYAFVCLS